MPPGFFPVSIPNIQYTGEAKLAFKLLERLNALSYPVVQNISIGLSRGRGSDAFSLSLLSH
jgi:hypothetical protein